MTNELQDEISEIPEITEYEPGQGGVHFIAALGWGSLAGTGGLMVAIALLELPGANLADLFGGMIFVSIFVAMFSLAGMVVIGLPVTLLLRAVGEERQVLYAVLGAVAGFAVLAVMMEFPRYGITEELILPGSGALAGFASAWRWGRWREQVATARQQERNAPPEKRDNPIHDLIH